MPAEEFYQVHTINLNRPPTVSTLTPRKPINSPPPGRPPPEGLLTPSTFLPTSTNLWVMWPSRSSKSTMPPPDQHLHPKGLPIPMTQTFTPSRHPLKLSQGIQPLQIHLSTLIWTTLSHVKPSPLMTPPLSNSWMPIPPITMSIVTHIYHVSKDSSSHYQSLIDRGTNGGLAGSDVRILEWTGRTLSVTGIGNHELPGFDIVTCAALLHTNHGKVILIMHEYAYYGRGNTIHSPGQIEWFQNTCDDKSFHVGGKQVITFLDGYATLLQCRTGLMYITF